MSLKKSDFVEMISDSTDMTRQESSTVFESFLDVIRDSLVKGEDVKISNFGKFRLQNKKSRRGRNPQTGDQIEISARRIVSFTPSTLLKDKINSAK